MAKSKKKTAASKKKPDNTKSRRLKQSSYKSFRLSKQIKSQAAKLPSAWRLMAGSLKLLRQNWKLFLGITLVYGLLTIILVRGFGGSLNLSELKANLQNGISGSLSSFSTAATLFTYLLGSSGTSSTPAGGVYQSLLIIVMSLVVIWSLRQVLASQKIGVRDGFYKGMYPLVPFILVLFVIGLQLVPFAVGSWVYGTVINNGIAVTTPEKLVWLIIFFLLVLLSLYMLCSSLFALYIVTLPDMTPMKALRSARQLVLHRRWTVLRKIIFLPISLLVLGAIIMFPLILWLTPLAEWVFFLLTMFVLVVVHTYMYSLYRELL
jgi:hypothetical protein